MAQSRTRFLGMDVHKETMAVASVAQEPGAEVTDLGPMGTRQCAIDPSCVRCHQKPHTSSSSMKQAPVAMGSPGL